MIDEHEAPLGAQAQYACFITAEGVELRVCGRLRQLLEMLIDDRERGVGTWKGGTSDRRWNIAAAARSLALEGVPIARRIQHFPDRHTVTSTGTVTSYYLLTEVRRAGTAEGSRAEMNAMNLAVEPLPTARDPFEPFLLSGSITSERQLQLLNPARLLPLGRVITARRGLAVAEVLHQLAQLDLQAADIELQRARSAAAAAATTTGEAGARLIADIELATASTRRTDAAIAARSARHALDRQRELLAEAEAVLADVRAARPFMLEAAE